MYTIHIMLKNRKSIHREFASRKECELHWADLRDKVGIGSRDVNTILIESEDSCVQLAYNGKEIIGGL